VTFGLALLIIAGAATLAALVYLLSRRLAPPEGWWGRPEPNHSGGTLAVLGSIFAILSAFVLFLSFQGFLNAHRNASAEAEAVEHMFHVAARFPPVARTALHTELVCYSRAVIGREWESMRSGARSADVEQRKQGIETALGKLEGSSNLQLAYINDFEESSRDRLVARRERLTQAQQGVPPLLWLALIAAATFLVLSLCTFANPSLRVPLQLWFVVAVTTVATLVLCSIAFLSTPFAGTTGTVQPSAMRESLTTMQREIAGSDDAAPVCDRSDVG
jgi:lysylphosphatidylglycerol synthetase-like protein (DUF2156 family)